jgi:hypothetical protein
MQFESITYVGFSKCTVLYKEKAATLHMPSALSKHATRSSACTLAFFLFTAGPAAVAILAAAAAVCIQPSPGRWHRVAVAACLQCWATQSPEAGWLQPWPHCSEVPANVVTAGAIGALPRVARKPAVCGLGAAFQQHARCHLHTWMHGRTLV